MSKEAKIGMLTGLGVIVLIGVLLSQYLGDKNIGTTNVPTGQMAPLPVGAAYREQLLSPVGVPAMAPAGEVVQLAGGTAIAMPMTHDSMMLPPAMVAAEATETVVGPLAAGPVTPIEVGPIVAGADSRVDGPPVISLNETVPVKLSNPKPTAVTHTIAAGDTLAKIAKQYYGAAKNSDVQKIVAANPGVLKDATTTLVVNKKLVVPGVMPAVTPISVIAGQVRPIAGQVRPGARFGTATTTDGVIVYLPSSSMTDAVPPAIGPVSPPKKADAAKPDAPKTDNKDTARKTGTYVVQSGDTLEKIARKIAPAKSQEMVQKLMSLNGIKDPTRLQAGAPLKVPA